MNRNQLVLLLILVAVIGGAGLLLYQKRSTAYTGGAAAIGQKLLGDLPVNDVAQILIQHGGEELTLARVDDRWRVRERGDYPANFAEISSLLLKLRDLKVVQTEQVGLSQLGRLELLPPGPTDNTATLLELRDTSGKPLRTLMLGKKHMRKPATPSPGGLDSEGWPDGRYVMVGREAGSVAVISDPLTNIEPKPETWLSKDFFRVEKIRMLAVTFPEATNSWRVTRASESAEWQLADAKEGEQLDASKTSGFNYALSSPSFNDLVLDADPETTGLNAPTEVVIETFDGFRYELKVGAKQDDNYHLTVNVSADLVNERAADENESAEDKAKRDQEFADAQKKLQDKLTQEQALGKWTYRVSSWTLDSVLKPRSELLTTASASDESDEDEDESPPMPEPSVLDADPFR